MLGLINHKPQTSVAEQSCDSLDGSLCGTPGLSAPSTALEIPLGVTGSSSSSSRSLNFHIKRNNSPAAGRRIVMKSIKKKNESNRSKYPCMHCTTSTVISHLFTHNQKTEKQHGQMHYSGRIHPGVLFCLLYLVQSGSFITQLPKDSIRCYGDNRDTTR